MIEIDKVLNTILNESIELPEVLVQGLTNNSSKVKKGYIFFAFKGENNDGNDFIEDAFKNGACLAITDSYKIESQKNLIKINHIKNKTKIT